MYTNIIWRRKFPHYLGNFIFTVLLSYYKCVIHHCVEPFIFFEIKVSLPLYIYLNIRSIYNVFNFGVTRILSKQNDQPIPREKHKEKKTRVKV